MHIGLITTVFFLIYASAGDAHQMQPASNQRHRARSQPSCAAGQSCVQPSGSYKKRDLQLRLFCPVNQTACPVGRNGFECIDTTSNIESCGGCLSEGKGVDCGGIEGVADVNCLRGRCVVATCDRGWSVDVDRNQCERDFGKANKKSIWPSGVREETERSWDL